MSHGQRHHTNENAEIMDTSSSQGGSFFMLPLCDSEVSMVSAFSFVCCRYGLVLRLFYVIVFAVCGVVIIFVLCV